MAGACTVDIKVKVTGLGDTITRENSVTMTVPVEVQTGYTVLATATTTGLQLFDAIDHIALAKIYGVYIKAVVGTVYISPDTAGTTSITSTTADFVLNVGEACYLPINPAGNLGLVVDGSAVTAAIEWMILGKA
jgi:hypothetical protein